VDTARLQTAQLVTGAAAALGGTARTDWILASGLTDPQGIHLSDQAEADVLNAARAAGGSTGDYLNAHGYGHWALLQPADRFWHFQILEATLYAVLALSCQVASVLILRRRPR
jgi:hypothetical protein